MLKNKILNIMLIIIIIGILITSVFIYRSSCRKILYGYMDGVRIGKVDKDLNFAMPKKKREEVSKNLDEYVYVYYKFKVSNTSDKFRITDINLEPQSKDNVVWYDSNEDVYDGQSNLNIKETKGDERTILVKRNGRTDDEIINMARDDKFEMTYWTIEGDSILSMGKSKQIVEYKGN